MTGISWTRCSQVYSDLTEVERDCLKQLRVGDVSGCTDGVMEHLVKMHLVFLLVDRYELTQEGRIIALFCQK